MPSRASRLVTAAREWINRRPPHHELTIPPLPPVPPDAPRLPGLPDHVDDGSPYGRYAPEDGDR